MNNRVLSFPASEREQGRQRYREESEWWWRARPWMALIPVPSCGRSYDELAERECSEIAAVARLPNPKLRIRKRPHRHHGSSPVSHSEDVPERIPRMSGTYTTRTLPEPALFDVERRRGRPAERARTHPSLDPAPLPACPEAGCS